MGGGATNRGLISVNTNRHNRQDDLNHEQTEESEEGKE